MTASVVYQVGKDVTLGGKTYFIAGKKDRSFILERDGKKYKATAAKMDKIRKQDEEFSSSTFYMEQRLKFNKIFDEDARFPQSDEEMFDWLDSIRAELEPERLFADGERSRKEAQQIAQALYAEWREVENYMGKKVTEDDVERYSFAKYQSKVAQRNPLS